MSDEIREVGMAVRRKVLGDDYVDRSVANTTEFTAPFQEFVTESVWGKVWAREGLDRHTRRCITIALLAALGHLDELEMHVRGALRDDFTSEEISEVLLHTAAYAGVSPVFTALARAQEVIRQESA